MPFHWKPVSLTDCTQLLRELANAIGGPVLFTFEWPGRWRDVAVDWKRENTTLQENREKRFGNLQANQLHLSP